jgi:hypothetical protein
MTSPNDKQFPPPEPGLDAVVRAQLDAEASRVDAAKMWDRVNAQLAADVSVATPAAPRHVSRRWFVFAGIAASALVGVFLMDSPREVSATPAQVVESARAAYSPDADRTYTQTVQVPRTAAGPLAHLLDGGRTVTLCTRGDRFFVEPGFGGRGAWGRDANGRVWIAPLRDDAAARFDEAELPPAMRDAVKIRSLELGPLLDEVLKDFDLSWSEPPAPGAATSAVTATRRGAVRPWQIRSADLVVEKGTNVLRSLVLRRALAVGDPVVITFTLVPSGERNDAAYTAEGHIDSGKPVFGSTRPILRKRVLLQNLGDILVNGL